MADCECLEGCPFFNDRMKETAGIGALYKRQYCRGDNAECARHMVFSKLGKTGVPDDLYPNMQDRVSGILAEQ